MPSSLSQSSSHGGARVGAGRPPKPVQRKNVIIDKLRGTLHSAQQETVALRSEITALRAERDVTVAECDRLRQQFTAATEQLTAASERVAQLMQQLNAVNRRTTRLRQQHEGLKLEKQSHEAAVETAREKLLPLKQQCGTQ